MKNINRRQILRGAIGGLGVLVANKALGQTCEPTPTQPKGPFYPVEKPLGTNADLTVVDEVGVAQGEPVVIHGLVMGDDCQPISGALVEIWQACHTGRYNHPIDPNTAPLDPNFQYFAQVMTDNKGRYSFKTIIPGAYPADENWIRPPHIHWQIKKIGFQSLITQTFFDDERFTSLNNNDLILQDLSESDQKKVLIPFKKTGDFFSIPNGEFNITLKKLKRPGKK